MNGATNGKPGSRLSANEITQFPVSREAQGEDRKGGDCTVGTIWMETPKSLLFKKKIIPTKNSTF